MRASGEIASPGMATANSNDKYLVGQIKRTVNLEYQIQIWALFRKLMPHGKIMSERPVSTADGVRDVEVAWASRAHWREVVNRASFVVAQEVWICRAFGKMSFFATGCVAIEHPTLCPEFPAQIEEQ